MVSGTSRKHRNIKILRRSQRKFLPNFFLKTEETDKSVDSTFWTRYQACIHYKATFIFSNTLEKTCFCKRNISFDTLNIFGSSDSASVMACAANRILRALIIWTSVTRSGVRQSVDL